MFLTEPTHSIQKIAESVLRLSDFYIENPDSQTPWHEEFCEIAYKNYYFPLNFLRNKQVVERGQQVGFFSDLTTFVDWGAGPGTASFALAAHEVLKNQIKQQFMLDRTDSPYKLFSSEHSKLIQPSYSTATDLRRLSLDKNKSCLVFSYSLTEIETLPGTWDQFEALMILEPATSEDGRKLLELRKKLIEHGYSIWAPCTHQLSCPLLTKSNHDWCHDRAKVEAPDWFWDLNKILPIKNNTVTTSYLLARKKKAPTYSANHGRLTGDSRDEKGKTRQLICRNEEREFLTWMHKEIDPQTLDRGELVELHSNFEIKSNELRLKEKLVVNTTS